MKLRHKLIFLSNTPKFWYKKNWLSLFLFPFSIIYQIIILLRLLLFRFGLLKTVNFPVPLIVVGNITVGGTGKTPLVIWLAKFLQAQGWRPGIVSRGYGGKAKQYPQWVRENSNPIEMGDEAVLISQKTQCPLVVDPQRVNAVQALLANDACNIIISDDGLQHYAMGRTIEIAVIDNTRKFGNGFCLPAGPLREPLTRLNQVDFVISNGNEKSMPLFTEKMYSMQLVPGAIYQLIDPKNILTLDKAASFSIHAVAGIGNPARFFTTLKQLGYSFQAHTFPDHYRYTLSDLDFGKNALIIMTEKDAVKCALFKQNNIWCLPIEAKITDIFSSDLLKLLNN